MKAKPILFGYSIVGWLNLLFFQWFFLRIFGMLHVDVDEEIDFDSEPRDGSDGRHYSGFGIMGFIVPLSGWSGSYIYFGKGFSLFFKRNLRRFLITKQEHNYNS